MQQLHFKHKTGSRKNIPGVRSVDCEPRMKIVSRYEPQIAKHIQVFERDPHHVVKVNLAELPDIELTEIEKKLPERIQERRLEAKADEYESVTRMNEQFVREIKRLEKGGEICDVEIVEVDDLAQDQSPTLDLTEIAYRDYIDRNIPIPENIRKANAERIAGWENADALTAKRSTQALKEATATTPDGEVEEGEPIVTPTDDPPTDPAPKATKGKK